MPSKCEHHQPSRKPPKDDVQRRQHQIYSAVQFRFKYKFIPGGHSKKLNSNLKSVVFPSSWNKLRENKSQSEDFLEKSPLSIPPQKRCNFIPSKLFLAACWSDRRAPSRCLIQFQSRSPEDAMYFLFCNRCFKLTMAVNQQTILETSSIDRCFPGIAGTPVMKSWVLRGNIGFWTIIVTTDFSTWTVWWQQICSRRAHVPIETWYNDFSSRDQSFQLEDP